jgi:hypothetical protein
VAHRVLPDEWELYDLDADPVEARNRCDDPDAAAVFAVLQERLKAERHRCVPERNRPWPYVKSRMTTVTGVPLLPPRELIVQGVRQQAQQRMAQRRGQRGTDAPPPAKLVRRGLQRLGLHPDDDEPLRGDVTGRRALVVATNHGQLDLGKPTGVFASELTVPYYAFLDAGMVVDVASPRGGVIPVDPQSLKPAIRTAADDRLLGDDDLRGKLAESLAIGDLDMDDYAIVYLAGGWGAAFDLGTSEALAVRSPPPTPPAPSSAGCATVRSDC